MRRKPILLGWLGLQLAATLAAGETITIQQAVSEALDKNLGLLAERYNVPIAQARIVTAKLRPNPVLTVGADFVDWLGTGFSRLTTDPKVLNGGPPEYNARVDFLWESGGKRERRIDVAE